MGQEKARLQEWEGGEGAHSAAGSSDVLVVAAQL